ncbi:MAG: serine/threonine protein kinase [Myxococcales bacterium]|nr:serine/threonine protein kinase [Myxococcales bacterium]
MSRVKLARRLMPVDVDVPEHLRETAAGGATPDPALSLRATQAATPAVARDLSLRDTQHTDAHAAALVGTLETIAPPDAVTRGAPLPAPDIDGVEADRLKGAIMAELFGGPAAVARIGRFTVLDRLGEGGMGVVYAAYDAQLDRKVAVKLLRRDTVGNDAGARKRLLREAQAMARVGHPNLITVHEAGEHHDSVYVAMEFVKGRSLDGWLATRPPWREVLAVFRAAGAGLAAAHAAGVVHRDFKPHNVMRGDDGSVKVLDFGLARAIDAAEETTYERAPGSLLDARMTRTGAVMGTPAYMAPEQHCGRVADARSDQYCFSVALYEGLFGRLPFAGETLPELVQNVLAARVLPPADATVPRWVTRVVLRGMALEPDERFPSLAAMLDALARDPQRRRRQALAGVAAGALLLVGGFGLANLAGGTGPQSCAGAADELAAVWSDERREAVRAGLTTAAPGLGARTWTAIAPRLDAYAGAWTAMRTAACEAHRSGRQSARLLDLRMVCLDRRLARLDALVAAFARADRDTVYKAVAAVDGLGDLAACADVERLTAVVPPPEDPARAEQVRGQQLALERAAAQQLTGHYAAAKTAAEVVSQVATRLEYPPLIAEAALARGRAHQELREAEPAAAALSEALTLAIRSRADAVAAEAAARELFVRAELQRAPEVALAGAAAADALVSRAGDPPETRWILALALGIARYHTGDFAGAGAAFARASEVASGADLRQAAVLTEATAGWLAASSGDIAAEVRHFAAGLAAAESTLGAEHPLAAQTGVWLVRARWELGQAEQARAALGDVVARLQASFGPDAPDVQFGQLLAVEIDLEYRRHAQALAAAEALLPRVSHPGTAAELERLLGRAHIAGGRIDEGVARMRRAVERSDDPMERLISTGYLGDALLDAGRLDAALAAHREALAGFEAASGLDSAYAAIVRGRLARTLLARGDLEAAHAAITAAKTSLSTAQPRSVYLAGMDETLGEVAAARGDVDAAITALRAAADRYAASFDDDHPARNAARFKLARALVDRSPAEAVALARKAGEVYAALGPAFAADAAAAQTWLKGQVVTPP